MSVLHTRGKSKYKPDGEKILTVICVAVCALLSFSLLLMSVLYMSMMLRNTLNVTKELPENVYYRLHGGAREKSRYDLSLCLPVFAGFRVEEYGGFIGISDDEAVMNIFCSALEKHIESVLCETGSCRKLGVEEGDKLWMGCPSHGSYVYLCFDGDIPDYYIRAFFCPDTQSECSGDIGIIHELFLIYEKKQDGRYSLNAVGRSDGGEVWSYVTGTDYTLDDIASYYRNSNFSPCEFFCNLDASEKDRYVLTLGGTAVIYDYGKRCESIRLINPGVCGADEGLFELFGYNPNKLNSYTEAGDVQVYVESHGTLRTGADGIVYSASADGGIPISDITGYTGSGYTLYDYALCCCSVIEKLDMMYPEIFGGECGVRLNSVKRSADTVNLDFVYTFSNCGITDNGKECVAYSFSICGGKLICAEANAMCVKGSGNYYAAYPQYWAMQRISEDLKDAGNTAGNMVLSYEIGKENGNGEYTANWSYITDIADKDGNSVGGDR